MGNTFFDLQVNGYAGVDFNDPRLTAEQLNRACVMLESHGVGGILATIITERVDEMCRSLQNIVRWREQDAPVRRIVQGFHIEGPFINETPGYRGAHPMDAVRPADGDAMRRLLEAGGGLVRLVTLAPERDPGFNVTRMLSDQKITVSAGHTAASLDELRGAIDAGLSMFTHVGNGCPLQLHRHDNIIQRAPSLSDRLWLCFIADGVHVPWPTLRNYLRVARPERTIVVTDCISAAGLGLGQYRIGRWDLLIGPDHVARAPDGSHFVGSAATMPRVKMNLMENLGMSEREVEAFTCVNPRTAVGMARET